MSKKNLLVIVLLLVSTPALGQEEAAAWRYFFFIESTIASSDATTWAQAVTTAAAAHREHEAGNTWAAFRRLTGGPDEVVTFYFPLDSMGDLDAWQPHRRILIETVGKDQARIALEVLELGAETVEGVTSYARGLSLPPAASGPGAPPPRYFWLERVAVEEGRMAEYVALAKRLRDAHEDHPAGLRWRVYGNAIGGDKDELLYYYAFESFAEIDVWPSSQEVLTAAIGARDAARLLAALEAVSEKTTSLWQLEPELSQLGIE